MQLLGSLGSSWSMDKVPALLVARVGAGPS